MVKSKEEIKSLSKEIAFDDGPTFIEIFIKKGARANLGRPKSDPQDNKVQFMNNIK